MALEAFVIGLNLRVARGDGIGEVWCSGTVP